MTDIDDSRAHNKWRQREHDLQTLNDQKLTQLFRAYQCLRETPLSIETGILHRVLRLLRFSWWLTHTIISSRIQEPGSSYDIVEEWGRDQTLVHIDIVCELGGLGGRDPDMYMFMFTGLTCAFQRMLDKMEPVGADKVEKKMFCQRPFYCWDDLKCMQWCKVIFNKDFSPAVHEGEELFSVLLHQVCSFVQDWREEREV
jgi:hypothetical protein